jgi:hypothetical protein
MTVTCMIKAYEKRFPGLIISPVSSASWMQLRERICSPLLHPLVSLQTTSSKEFRSQGRILGVMAAPDSRAGHGRCFPYPSHFHAEMMSFKKNGHTVWVQHGFQGVRDLLTDPFLYGKALRKKPYQAG